MKYKELIGDAQKFIYTMLINSKDRKNRIGIILQLGTNTEDQEINLGKHTHGSSLAIPKFSTFTLLWGAATLN
jgi:hypothetical protein